MRPIILRLRIISNTLLFFMFLLNYQGTYWSKSVVVGKLSNLKVHVLLRLSTNTMMLCYFTVRLLIFSLFVDSK